jgi:hypothetical protein
LDVVTANIVEPLLIGHSTGVSSTALLVMALFWTWLWGPIGLLLTTPLTVCLVVLGKHVPQLESLAVLLGDAPALEPEISYYQRLLAGDDDEASVIVEQRLQQKASPVQVFDEVLAPALLLATRDHAREEITDTEHEFVLHAVRETVQQWTDTTTSEQRTISMEARHSPSTSLPAKILGIPARSEGSHLALDVLRASLDPTLYTVESLSTATLAAEVPTAITQEQPDLVCITALPPGGLSQARYLCKRLRSQFSDLRILVIRPGLQTDSEFDVEPTVQRLTEAGADRVAVSITEAQTMISQMLTPVRLRSAADEYPPTATELVPNQA